MCEGRGHVRGSRACAMVAIGARMARESQHTSAVQSAHAQNRIGGTVRVRVWDRVRVWNRVEVWDRVEVKLAQEGSG